MAAMTDLERRIVATAEELGMVGELCDFVEYDPDIGRVPEHFRPRYPVLRLFQKLTAGGAAPAPASEGYQPLLGAAANAAVHLSHCYQGECEHSCKYGFDDCPAADRAATEGLQTDASTLHQRIMDLPCNELHAGSPREDVQRAYGEGHKRARRDAAELVSAAFAGGLAKADLRERLTQLMLSFGSQCVEADRALREVREGKDNAQREVDYRNGLAQKAIDKLLEYFPDPQPAPDTGART